MFMSNKDFVCFCMHLDHFLAQDLEFIPTEFAFPVATLPGNEAVLPITLYFNHAKEPKNARKDWDRRKSRINRNNLFLIMYNLDNVKLETIQQLEQVQCRNKVILTAQPLPEIPWSLQIKPTPHRANNYTYLDKDMLGRTTFEKHFDFVSWLNTPDAATKQSL